MTRPTSSARRGLLPLAGGAAVAVAAIAALNLLGVIGQDRAHLPAPAHHGTGAHLAPSGAIVDRGHVDGLLAAPDQQSLGPGKACKAATHLADINDVRTDDVYFRASVPATDVWTCAEGAAPYLMYGDVQVSFEQGTADEALDLQAHMEGLAKEFGDGRVEDIQGRPSWVGEGDKDAGVYTYAVMIVNGTTVNVLAQADVPLSEVLEVADSLDLPAAK